MRCWIGHRGRLTNHAAAAGGVPATVPHRLRGLPVPDPARHPRRAHRPGPVAVARSVDDPYPADPSDRPGRAQRWPAVAPVEEGHADHGRRADPHRHRRQHPALGRPEQPLRVDRAGRDPAVRRHRLGRRLPQGDREELARPAEPLEVFLAVGVRPGCRRLPLYDRTEPGGNHPDRAGAEGRGHSAGRRLRGADLLRHRRHQQRGKPDRRPRRPGHPADRDGGRRAGDLLLPVGQHQIRRIPADSLRAGRRRADRVLRRAGRCRPRLPVV